MLEEFEKSPDNYKAQFVDALMKVKGRAPRICLMRNAEGREKWTATVQYHNQKDNSGRIRHHWTVIGTKTLPSY